MSTFDTSKTTFLGLEATSMRTQRNRMRRTIPSQWLGLAGLAAAIQLVGCASGVRPVVLSDVVSKLPSANLTTAADANSAAYSETFSDFSSIPATSATVYARPGNEQRSRGASAGTSRLSDEPVVQVAYQEVSGNCGPGACRWGVAGPGTGACPSCANGMQGCGTFAGMGGANGGICPPGLSPSGWPAFIPNPQGIDPNEFLCNGDDAPPAARAHVGDGIVGVGLEDTVARYTTDRGAVHVEPSNRVCIYAPRFGTVRRVTGAELGELAVGPRRVLRQDSPIGVDHEVPGLAVTGRDRLYRSDWVRGPDAVRMRDRGVPVENVLQPLLAEDVLELLANLSIIQRGVLEQEDLPILERCVQAAVVWSVDQEVGVVINGQTAATVTRDQAARELVVYEFPDGRLRICKCSDVADGVSGDIVTFVLRIDNVGDSPLRDVVVTDSLTTRLEYVADSQTSSREAEFSFAENEGQSLRLTWKIPGELKVGEGATIQFKCKVR
jgi:uncharacterized repeat protein (TIGR01451 family)